MFKIGRVASEPCIEHDEACRALLKTRRLVGGAKARICVMFVDAQHAREGTIENSLLDGVPTVEEVEECEDACYAELNFSLREEAVSSLVEKCLKSGYFGAEGDTVRALVDAQSEEFDENDN